MRKYFFILLFSVLGNYLQAQNTGAENDNTNIPIGCGTQSLMIIDSPADQITDSGNTVSFMASAWGSDVSNWQVSTDNGLTWTDLDLI